jgi:hypothetical protein
VSTVALAGKRVVYGFRGDDDVMKNLEGVVLAIDQAAALVAPPSLTLPRKGGGNGNSDGAL